MRRCPSLGGRRQQRRETGEERHVDGDQGGRGEIPLEAGRPVTQPPDHGAQHRDQQPQAERVRAGEPGQPHGQHATGDQRHQRRMRAAAPDRAGHLPTADGDRGGDHRQERQRVDEQRHHDQRAEAEPDPDRRGKVAPGPPGAHLLGGRPVEAGPPSPLRPSTGRRGLVRRHLGPDGLELLGRVPRVVETGGRAVETARLVEAPTVRAVVTGRRVASGGRSVRVPVATNPVVVPVGLVAVVHVPVAVVEAVVPVAVVEAVVRPATLVVRVRRVRVGVRPGVRVGVQLRAGGRTAAPLAGLQLLVRPGQRHLALRSVPAARLAAVGVGVGHHAPRRGTRTTT